MHVEKNVCDSLVGMLLNISDKTKDGPKARVDKTKELWERQAMTNTLLKTNLPPACYTLKRAEMHSLCKFLHGVQVSSCYLAKIGKLVDMKKPARHLSYLLQLGVSWNQESARQS